MSAATVGAEGEWLTDEDDAADRSRGVDSTYTNTHLQSNSNTIRLARIRGPSAISSRHTSHRAVARACCASAVVTPHALSRQGGK
jgi:hypothetical protein